jgi:hypothetical protein
MRPGPTTQRAMRVLLLILAMLPAVAPISPFRINFNFLRPHGQGQPDSSLSPGIPEAAAYNESERTGGAMDASAPPALERHTAFAIPVPAALAMGAPPPHHWQQGVLQNQVMQQVQIPIQIPATGTTPAHSVNLLVMAPQGVQIRMAPPEHNSQHPDVRNTHSTHHAQHQQPEPQPHEHHTHTHTHHHHAPGQCRHNQQPTPGQLAVQQMLQIASQQCNQVQCAQAGAPFHWPDRVFVCAHTPDDSGNTLQVVMMHRTQRAGAFVSGPRAVCVSGGGRVCVCVCARACVYLHN